MQRLGTKVGCKGSAQMQRTNAGHKGCEVRMHRQGKRQGAKATFASFIPCLFALHAMPLRPLYPTSVLFMSCLHVLCALLSCTSLDFVPLCHAFMHFAPCLRVLIALYLNGKYFDFDLVDQNEILNIWTHWN